MNMYETSYLSIYTQKNKMKLQKLLKHMRSLSVAVLAERSPPFQMCGTTNTGTTYIPQPLTAEQACCISEPVLVWGSAFPGLPKQYAIP